MNASVSALGTFAVMAALTPLVFDLAWSLFVRLSK